MAEKPSPATEKVENFGLPAICGLICEGVSLTDIAARIGVSFGTFHGWLEADAERSARAREARKATAKLWDEMGERRIDMATDPFELAKAKELAFHYRWRASKIAPQEYGDKQTVKLEGEVGLRNLSRDELIAKAAALDAAVAERLNVTQS